MNKIFKVKIRLKERVNSLMGIKFFPSNEGKTLIDLQQFLELNSPEMRNFQISN